MLRKMLSTAVAMGVIAFFSNAYADGNSGCGLGTTIWEGKKGLFPHLLAATTNGTSGNQTFGMTSGTSGCNVDGAVVIEKKQEVFVAVNFDNLSEQMAQGKGEHLAAFGSLMGCSKEQLADFSAVTQEKYSQIFSETGSAKQIIDNTKSVMASSKSCNNI